MKYLVCFIASLFVTSCSTQMNEPEADSGFGIEDYYVWSGGEYVKKDLTEEPNSNLGTEGFLIKLYNSFKYPAAARNAGVQGTVIIQLTIDDKGNLKNSIVKEGIGYGCDEAALNAVNEASEAGFVPAMIDGVPVEVQFEIPVNFKL